MALPLEGVRIVDLTVVWAGPFGAMQLADLGAEVIKVESLQYYFPARRGRQLSRQFLEAQPLFSYGYAGRGLDPERRFNPNRLFNASTTFNWYARNEKSMTVDLTRPEGVEIFKRLVSISDGVIDNQAARNVENLGLDYEVLSQVNPNIIMIRMPGWGISGPYWHRLGYGYTMDAIGGHTSLRYYPDRDPITSSVFHGDACGGAILAAIFMMALHYRNRTGKGQLIDISQTENAQCTYAPAFMDYFMNGRVQGTLGNRDATMLQGIYRCKMLEPDRGGESWWWVLSIENDEQWRAFCRVMGQPELADDPRFADAINRKKNEELLDPIITEWAQDKDQYQIMHLLQAEGIPAGPVIDYPDELHDPHLVARGAFPIIDHSEIGPYPYAGPLYKLSETPCRTERIPCLGEDNDYVYRELLGYSDEEIQRLIAEKHIGMDYLPNAI